MPGGSEVPPLPSSLPLVARAEAHDDRTAIVAPEGTFTYRDLPDASAPVAACLLDGPPELADPRVALLAPAGWHYVAAHGGIRRAGRIAVPRATSHPPAEL